MTIKVIKTKPNRGGKRPAVQFRCSGGDAGGSMNYKPAVKTNMADDFSTNALVFATKEEAQASADELSWRWLAVVDTGVIETEEPVNYRFVNGKNVRLE